ncbi:metal-dependent transcriptional regulator [Candidatus Poriferisodalis sp.]|uniref:metal-dependent transcriptional regulator n=1 Tax=Candidatus Poriferisodalis sp. TaxID=3101277 RepID=UPI003B018B15
MSYKPVEYHPAFEEYSETVYELAEDGVEVIQARIAERLDVSRPAVSEMIRRMRREGLVKVDDDAHISLTHEGEQIATTVVRRHRLAERFLTDILKLSWADAHHEAGRWEHVISPVVEQAMMKVLHDPNTCPHGNPIPGTDYEAPRDVTPLAQIDAGCAFTVQRIPEELEFEPGQLEFLEKSGLMPGRVGTMMSVSPDGTATVGMSEGAIGVSAYTAERILVTSAGGTPAT